MAAIRANQQRAARRIRLDRYSSFLPNALRDEIQESAPHILLTNYAMLEYLLMRPADSSIFECGPNGWKFVVLDEVHSYDGALGLEVAMLLRRLFERVGRSGRVRCIGTSATIGEGAADAGKVAAFASSLFSSSFEYDPADPRRQDIVLATRMEHTLPPPSENLPTDELLSVDDPHKLVEDIRVQSALDRIWQGPVTFTDLSTTFPDCSDPEATTRHVLTCLSSAPYVDDTPLLRARYHTFVRAIPGADICIRTHTSGRMRVFFEPHRWCDECGEGAELLELASCRRCGQWHIR
ncbi:MAG: hypothetical protein LC118_13165, partial [Dehalococcoidia bacterium]|nr:hypothetical protein [Dehalococcoidia bacterium]